VSKSAIDETSSFTFLFTLGLVQIPVSLGFLYIEKENFKTTTLALTAFQKYKLLFIAAFLIALAQLFFWLSFENTKASIASPITSTNSMFTVILTFIILKEQLDRKKLVGILFVFAGIVGIAFT
jgi:drug/metabolite transporter (DMT)-like permease